jgi:hypothetical protein
MIINIIFLLLLHIQSDIVYRVHIHIHGTVIRSTDVHIALRSFLTPRLICRLRMATAKPWADHVCIACVVIIGHTEHTIRTVHTMHVIHVQYRTHICLIYTCIHRRQSMWGNPHDIMVYVDRSLCWLLAFLSPFPKVRCMAFMYAFYTCFYVFMNRRFVSFLRMIWFVCMYVRKKYDKPHVCILVCAHLDHYYDILGGARQG